MSTQTEELAARNCQNAIFQISRPRQISMLARDPHDCVDSLVARKVRTILVATLIFTHHHHDPNLKIGQRFVWVMVVRCGE